MKQICIFLLITLLAGCAVQKTDVKTDGFEAIQKPAPDYSNGSIWQSASSGLTEDLKARRRGDTLTIVISEVASASKAAKTDTARGSEMSAGIPNFMGLEGTGAASKYLGDLTKMISASNASKFAGSGSTSRDESLKATITARVVDVLPNGNLLIEGRRNIKVNNEDQEIVLEGTVRSRDVTPENTVNSIYVANAKISYSGRGIISDQQSPGWLMSIIDKVWPF